MNKNILIESLDSLISENNNNDLRVKSEYKLLQKNHLQKNLTYIIITFTSMNI